MNAAVRCTQRGNGMNDERHKKDALTRGVPQEALLNMSLSVILECEATCST
jgi:hypothetical protein